MRRSGRQMVRDGWLRYVPKKTLYKRHDMSQKPWLPELAAIVEASPCGAMPFLGSEYGKPFTTAGFGTGSGSAVPRPGYPHARLTGLRRPGRRLPPRMAQPRRD